ncbi:Fic family protein [Aureispira anguillae]|uniref:Fic family protein n=1 Tax=Aureispira anguillae TaxID=2864201 RepID=A0A915YJY4_9BACT|nr:Fic family protein [Aureispira anguillae]BDS14347.1 Fic family protein [Aureispira anguillae]
MAHPSKKLAESLAILRELQQTTGIAIKTSEISRTHRERLNRNGFLQKVAKGWYITTNPNEKAGDSSSWYTSYWQFCSRYLNEKYTNQYCISADQSIMIHSGNNTIPQQLIVRALKAPNLAINLLHDTSLFIWKSPLPASIEMTVKNGVNIMTIPLALIHCSPSIFEKNPIEVTTVLAQIRSSSEIITHLLNGSHSVIAGRLAGAFRNIGQNQFANDIIKTMTAADFRVREINPFKTKPLIKLSFRNPSPYPNRLKLMWQNMRTLVLKHFPDPPGLPKDKTQYLKSIDAIYVTDAYHSLSIEQYNVSPQLIEKVKTGDWDIKNEGDKKQRDAMAARGYWQATQVVRNSIKSILNGANPGEIIEQDHGDWYRELFAPSVTAGILKVSELAGYRTHQVYITQSKHIPLNKDAVLDSMPILFELLKTEPHAGVRAVLGHFIFVYIHPYIDGNGRMARFLMNTMLASGGYPWTVIPLEKRKNYMDSLEKISVDQNIEPFVIFIADLVKQNLID